MQPLKSHTGQQLLLPIAIALLFIFSFLAGYWSHEKSAVFLKSIPALIYMLALLAGYSWVMRTRLNSFNWSLQFTLALFTTCLFSSLILQIIYPNGPWHSLSIQNDAAHSLNMARQMANGEYSLSFFLPLWRGRASLTMSFESFFFHFFDAYELGYLILSMQSLYLFSLIVVAAHIFKDKIKLQKSHLLLSAAALAFFPYIFFSSVHMDMYWLSPLWILLTISFLSLDFPNNKFTELAYGLIIGSGLFISPSLKIFVPIAATAFILLNWKDKKKLLFFSLGLGANLLAFLGLWLKFGPELVDREQWLFKAYFLDPVAHMGMWDFLVQRLQLIHTNLFQGQFMYFIFDRIDRVPGIVSPISMFTWPLLLSALVLYKVPRLAMASLLIVLVTIAQLIVAETTDYRTIHILPIWGLALAFSIFILFSEKNWKRLVVFSLPIVIQAHFFFKIYQDMDYRFITTNYEVRESLWTTMEVVDGPDLQVASMQMGTAELFLPPRHAALGINFGTLRPSEKILRINKFLNTYGDIRIRMSETEFAKLNPVFKKWKAEGFQYQARKVESGTWPGLYGYLVFIKKNK